MSSESSRLKSNIRNLSKKLKISAQVILQNYMFERFLYRVSKSQYKDNFVLKGGMLIGSIVGVDNRSTMDMDVTITHYPLHNEFLKAMIKEICNMAVDDVIFNFRDIDFIREDDEYGGCRIHLLATYDEIRTPLKIDITTGDVITPREINYQYNLLFGGETINLLTYNIETILAEKMETILRRMEINTRIRDFYDVYILTKTQKYKNELFYKAFNNTVAHRNTKHILNNINHRISTLQKSDTLKTRWNKYSQEYNYACEIDYVDIMSMITALSKTIN